MAKQKADEIREAVRQNYRSVARSISSASCNCCSPSCCDGSDIAATEEISIVMGYTTDAPSAVPVGANMGLGCGNPLAIASLKPGETVLDLGSGGGFDAFLAAGAVGETGCVIGVDMTPEMVRKARALAAENDYDNVEFHLGEIEELPLEDNSVDVIISNCVINLSPEKERVFQEAFRVLKSGGRLAVSDVVATAELPAEVKDNLALHSQCIAGASCITALEAMLEQTGFAAINIRPKEDSHVFIRDWAPDLHVEQFIVSAIIEAVKPINR